MIRIVQVGLGPLGQRVVRHLLGRPSLRLAAAVDPAHDKAGKDVGVLCGVGPLGVAVSGDLRSALRSARAEVAVLTTVSSIARIEPQVAELVRAGLRVVTTCEELSFPWRTAPWIARRLDAACRKHRVACLATGVNPGFLMDFLPSVLTGVCEGVTRVVVERMQDASTRRVPFQKKIGAGLTRAQFRTMRATAALRHVGLTESMHMIAHALGWRLDRTTETLRPVIADRETAGGFAPIRPGMACGVEQVARAYVGRRAVIVLHFRAAVGEPRSYDAIEITGQPTIRSVIEGGVNGDIATCAVTLNAIPSVMAADPGLKTMLDIAAPTCRRAEA